MEAYLESVEKRAEELLERAQNIIIAEKAAQGLTVKHLVNRTNLSEDVIKNICSTKKHLKNTGYITMTTTAMALGLDLNYLADYQPPNKSEVVAASQTTEASIAQLEEFIKALEKQMDIIVSVCEARVTDAERNCEARIADVERNCETRIAELKENQAEYIKVLMSAK